MKRVSALIGAICLFLTYFSGFAAFASESEDGGGNVKEPSNVTITVVLPEPSAAPEPEETEEAEQAAPSFIKVYPSDVTETRGGGEWRIIKTYELRPDENPADIPRASFERGGYTFTLTDILRRETANAETREHTETVTLSTDTKELEKILPLFAPTLEYKADDGFVGILSLDVSSIKAETAGTKTSSHTMSVTREYPRLSSNDTSLVPKQVEDRGKTYTLAGVDWRAGNNVTVDYDALPEYYTAIATYTATGTSTKVTGYTTTAVYTGTLAKLSQGKTVYTAYFEGAEIRTPPEMTEPTEQAHTGESETAAGPTEQPTAEPSGGGETNRGNNALLVLIPVLGAAASVLYCFMKKRKGKPHDEKAHNPAVDADTDGGDGGSGSGG